MIVPTFAQRPIYGYTWIVLAAVGTGFLSFGLWVHHMYATGLPSISLGFFSAASEAVAIPTGVQIFAFIATMLLGRVIFTVPMLRSEEHTSELQSLMRISYAVFCLKKKTIDTTRNILYIDYTAQTEIHKKHT